MPIVPNRFLFRIAYPCPHVPGIPLDDADELFELPDDCRIDNFATLDGQKNYGEVRLAWNEFGLAVQAEVRGKQQLPQGNATRLRGSDGLALWIDTRGSRTSHRASRFCHQFHFLPTGGGPDADQPVFGQMKINRALQDAAHVSSAEVPFQGNHVRGGYRIKAFLPAAALHGFDPDQNPRLGFYYAIQDAELGSQVLSVGADFPYWEDPSLWSVLELTGKKTRKSPTSSDDE